MKQRFRAKIYYLPGSRLWWLNIPDGPFLSFYTWESARDVLWWWCKKMHWQYHL